jgi:hypothetical protein
MNELLFEQVLAVEVLAVGPCSCHLGVKVFRRTGSSDRRRIKEVVHMSDPQAHLTAARVSFHTAGDDKDDDTTLTITIEKGPNVFASLENITGHFPDHSENGPFALQILGPVTKGELPGAFMKLRIEGNGCDTWQFNAFLELEYSDGSHQRFGWFHNEYTQFHNFLSFPFEEGIS